MKCQRNCSGWSQSARCILIALVAAGGLLNSAAPAMAVSTNSYAFGPQVTSPEGRVKDWYMDSGYFYGTAAYSRPNVATGDSAPMTAQYTTFTTYNYVWSTQPFYTYSRHEQLYIVDPYCMGHTGEARSSVIYFWGPSTLTP